MYSLPKSTPNPGSFSVCSLVSAVRKTRSPQTTGEDQPLPGISALHSMFCDADQDSGRSG